MQPNDTAEAAKLVHMANQIAAFFQPYPEAEAEAGIRDHLAAFWTHPMQEKLRAAPSDVARGLNPVVARIVGRPK